MWYPFCLYMALIFVVSKRKSNMNLLTVVIMPIIMFMVVALYVMWEEGDTDIEGFICAVLLMVVVLVVLFFTRVMLYRLVNLIFAGVCKLYDVIMSKLFKGNNDSKENTGNNERKWLTDEQLEEMKKDINLTKKKKEE